MAYQKPRSYWRNGSIISVTILSCDHSHSAHSPHQADQYSSFIYNMPQQLAMRVLQAVAQAIGQSVGQAITQELLANSKGIYDVMRLSRAMSVWKKRRMANQVTRDSKLKPNANPVPQIQSRL